MSAASAGAEARADACHFYPARCVYSRPLRDLPSIARACRLLLQKLMSPSMAHVGFAWLFVRGPDALTVERLSAMCLAVSSATGERHVHDFASTVNLLEFQLKLHAYLIETGWALDDFYPEHRPVVRSR